MANEANEPSTQRHGFWGTPDSQVPEAEDTETGTAWEPWRDSQESSLVSSEGTGTVPQFLTKAEEVRNADDVVDVEDADVESHASALGDTDPFWRPNVADTDAPDAGEAEKPAYHEGKGYIEDAEFIDEEQLLPEARSYAYEPNDYDDSLNPSAALTPAEKRVRIGAVIGAVVLALLAVYACGVYRFGNRFVPGSRIGDADFSGLTLADATAALQNDTASYTCTVTAGAFSTKVTAADCGYERDEEHMAADALSSQNAFLWPLFLIGSHELSVEQGVTYDEDALEQHIAAAVDAYNTKVVSSEGLSIAFDEETGLYRVDGTVSGKALDGKAVLKAAKEAVGNFASSADVPAAQAEHTATVDDVAAYRDSVSWANAVRTADIPLLLNGEEVLSATADQNAQWVTIGDGPSVVVDTDALTTWATDTVAPEVYSRDDYTDYKLDVEAFVSEFADRLSTGVVEGYEVPMYDQRRQEAKSRDYAYERGGWNSEMGRYIDIDLKAQFARLFSEEGEVIWESAFVSGSMIAARSTITGTFNIQSKQTNTVLVGFDYNGDGKPDYQSYVNYWMPFYGGYGLHDATWRQNFGGDLYYYEGSHGCINLPYEKASELYEIIQVGDMVYIHW